MQKCKQPNWRAYGKSIHLCCVHWRLDWTCFLNVNLVLCAKWKKTRLSSSSLRQSWWSWSAEVAGYSAPWSSWPDHVTAGPNIPKSIQEQGWSTLSNWTVTILPTNVLALLACLAPLGRGPSNFVMSYEAVPMQKSGPPHEWLLHALISTHGTPGGHFCGTRLTWSPWLWVLKSQKEGPWQQQVNFRSADFLNHDVRVQVLYNYGALSNCSTNSLGTSRTTMFSSGSSCGRTCWKGRTHSGLQISPLHTDNAMTLQSLPVRKTCATVQHMICTIKKRKEATIRAQRTQGRNGSHMVERCGRPWVFTPAQPLHLQLPRPDFHARTRPSPPAKLAALGTALRVTSLD